MEIGKQALLSGLQRFDLMGTGCSVDHFMGHEYAAEAERISRLVGDGRPLAEAITVTFEDHFWAGCLDEADRRQSLAQLLQDLGEPSESLAAARPQ